MRRFALAAVLFAALTGAAVLTAAAVADEKDTAAPAAPPGVPQLPTPAKEHAWLDQAIGQWDVEGEVVTSAGGPAITCKGTETVRAIGKFWTVAESESSFVGMPMTGVLTLGYDPEKNKYVGTWIDSMTSHLWHYEGTADAAGKALTLYAEGPNPAAPGTTAKFREVLEFKGKDHKVFTSAMQDGDGNWVQFVTMNYRRKK